MRADDLDVDELQAELLVVSREIAGVGGELDRRPLRTVLAESGSSLYPLVAIMALGTSQNLQSLGASAMQPEIARTLGVGPGFFVLVGLLTQAGGLAIPIITSQLVGVRRIRAVIMLVSAAVWGVATIAAGFIPTAFFLAVYMFADVVTAGPSGTVSSSLAIDLYPVRARVRAIAWEQSAFIVAGLVMPLLLVLLVGVFDLTWRGVFVVTGALSLLVVLAAVGLKDPGYGNFDSEHVRKRARDSLAELDGGDGAPLDVAPTPHPKLAEVYAALWSVKTLRLSLIGTLVASTTAPVGTYVAFFYARELNFGIIERSLLATGTGIVSLVSLILVAPYGDRLYQRDPKKLFRAAAWLSVFGTATLIISVAARNPGLAVALALVGAFVGGFVGPASIVGGLSVIPAEYRHYSGSVFAIFSLLGAGLGGAMLGGIGEQYGLVAALVALAIPEVIGAAVFGRSGDYFVEGIDSSNARFIEDETVRHLAASGQQPPLLSCRGIDFSYGPVQVLYDLDFDVHEGEMVALLGLNGSGKSTLLRVLSGLVQPTSGRVRYEGYDITFFGAERRAGLGMAMLPGGRGTFSSLTVRDNLRAAGYSIDRNLRTTRQNEAIERFPRLAELWDRPAVVLSGGEQQMLSLARAFIVRPRLLLIDELSLGLAPQVVADLLDAVRELNATGSSVVIVEQSINVALELTDRAVFLERGTKRFDGPTAELAQRNDLLRAVFLRENL